MVSSRFLIAILLAAPFPVGPAVAGSVIDTPVATIAIRDQRPDTCTGPLPSVCQWSADGETAGSLEVDAYQRIEYVGVAGNGSWVGGPSEQETIRGSDLYARHPVLITVTPMWQRTPQEYPGSSEARVGMDERGTHVWHPSHQGAPLLLGVDEPWSFEYSNGSVGYEQIGPYNAPTGNSTDNYVYPHLDKPCSFAGEGCRNAARDVGTHAMDASPNVLVGLEFYDLQVATSPEALREGRASSPVSGSHPKPPTAGADEARRDLAKRPQDVPPGEGSPGAPTDVDGPTRAESPSGAGLLITPVASPPTRPPSVSILIAAALTTILVWLCLLYARLRSKDQVLGSSTRRRLLEMVTENPGLTASEAARLVGVSRTSVIYHARLMSRLSLLRVVEGRNRFLLYPPMPATVAAADARFRPSPVAGRILRLVELGGGVVERSRVHDSLPDVPLRTRNHNIRWLVQEGLLVDTGTTLMQRPGGGS